MALVALWRWALRYMSVLEIAPEKRVLFAIVLVALVAFFAFANGLKLNKWRQGGQPDEIEDSGQTRAIGEADPLASNEEQTDINDQRLIEKPTQPLTEEQKLAQFEQQNYPDLYEQRTALYAEIRELDSFFQRINQLALVTPKQRSLLEDIYRIRKASRANLFARYLDVSQHLRNFWVHYTTGNPEDAVSKFNLLAGKISKDIRETRGDRLDDQRKEDTVISDYLREIGNRLKSNKLPSQQAGITTYSGNNRNMLIKWLQVNGSSELLGHLEQMVEQRALIRERSQKVQQFMQSYTDLRTTLQTTLDLWRQAMEHNYYAEYRLLHAAEAQYVLEQLNITSVVAASKRLDDDVANYLPKVMNHVNDTLAAAEEAYNPKATK